MKWLVTFSIAVAAAAPTFAAKTPPPAPVAAEAPLLPITTAGVVVFVSPLTCGDAARRVRDVSIFLDCVSGEEAVRTYAFRFGAPTPQADTVRLLAAHPDVEWVSRPMKPPRPAGQR